MLSMRLFCSNGLDAVRKTVRTSKIPSQIQSNEEISILEQSQYSESNRIKLLISVIFDQTTLITL